MNRMCALAIVLSPLFVLGCQNNEPADTNVVDTQDTGGHTDIPKDFALVGPWDQVGFASNSPYGCGNPNESRINFPPLINDDWDYQALSEIPADYIVELTDTALETKDHGPAACAMTYFQHFADNNAYYLESDCTENGQPAEHDYERSLFITGMVGLPLLKLRGDSYIEEAAWAGIEDWARKLMTCQQVMLKDRLSDSYISDFGGYHNSVYNASLAGLSLAIHLDDPEAFNEFLAGYTQALDHLNEDGTSQYELNHKGEAILFYHNIMANYASHVALLTDMNGHELLQHEKLRKMRELVLNDLNGGTVFQDLSLTEQTRDPRDEPWNFSWAYHVGRINSDDAALQLADQYAIDLVHTMTSGWPDRWWVDGSTLHQTYGPL